MQDEARDVRSTFDQADAERVQVVAATAALHAQVSDQYAASKASVDAARIETLKSFSWWCIPAALGGLILAAGHIWRSGK